MPTQAQIPSAAHADSRRFAVRLAVFYFALFGLLGTYLPFFTVWLKAIAIDAAWIDIITAVPAITRFTVLPLVTSLAERRQSLRNAIVLTAFASALGMALVGSQREAFAVFLVFAATCCLWTPMTPLTDAYALRGIARHGLNYGPLRLWGSAAFVAGALGCGAMLDRISPEHLIWVIAGVAGLGALASLGLQPIDSRVKSAAPPARASVLLRDRGFLAIIFASALIQSSHAAYYIFASITWKAAGLDGLTIAGLWSLGVLAEIVLFALSPRFRLPHALLVAIGALSAVIRWIITAQEPSIPVLAVVQLAHGLTFGLTQVGTMGLMVHHVPGQMMARGQGYLAACGGIIASSTSILCGLVYASYGQGVYYLMAVMAAAGGLTIWIARNRLARPRGAPSGV